MSKTVLLIIMFNCEHELLLEFLLRYQRYHIRYRNQKTQSLSYYYYYYHRLTEYLYFINRKRNFILDIYAFHFPLTEFVVRKIFD